MAYAQLISIIVNTIYILLFSINSLSLALVASLQGIEWTNFTPTQKFVLISAVVGSWTNTLLALVVKLQSSIKSGKSLIPIETSFFKKSETPSKPETPPQAS